MDGDKMNPGMMPDDDTEEKDEGEEAKPADNDSEEM